MLDKFFDPGLLQIIFGNPGCFFEPIDNLFDRRAIHATDFPGPFDQLAVDLDELRVQAP